MKKTYMLLLAAIFSCAIITNGIAEEKKSPGKAKKEMKRFVVERNFPNGFKLAMNDEGKNICQNVVLTNAEDEVTWVHSYFSEDGKKSYCVYDAPSAEAIRTAAKKNNLPADKITEVRVLDPYFFK